MSKPSQKSLPYKVLQNILKNKLILPHETVVVAVSGGADSVCLFSILFGLKEKLSIELKVCHYNHRLRGRASYNDSEFVKKLAEKFNTAFIYGEASEEKLYKSEDSAREARYGFFEKIFNKEGRGVKIALAHNANDLAETMLLRLVRGTGLFGLKSIPLRRKNFIRPLLPFSRKEIEGYLESNDIKYQTDKTNFDTRVTRNFIRLKVVPLLVKINPAFIEITSKTVNIIEDDYDFLSLSAQNTFDKIKLSENDTKIILSQKEWVKLHPSIQRLVLRQAIDKIDNLSDITQTQIDEVCQVLSRGEGNKYKALPRSLRVELRSGTIIVSKLSSQT